MYTYLFRVKRLYLELSKLLADFKSYRSLIVIGVYYFMPVEHIKLLLGFKFIINQPQVSVLQHGCFFQLQQRLFKQCCHFGVCFLVTTPREY